MFWRATTMACGLSALGAVGCSVPVCRPTPAEPFPTDPPAREAVDAVWKSRLGKVVTVRGTAVNSQKGFTPSVLADASDGYGQVDLDDERELPERLRNKRVCVTGRVIERYDLPVFTPEPNAPLRQGMAMPPGTDLRTASHRYLLAEPQIHLLAE